MNEDEQRRGGNGERLRTDIGPQRDGGEGDLVMAGWNERVWTGSRKRPWVGFGVDCGSSRAVGRIILAQCRLEVELKEFKWLGWIHRGLSFD
jgi:hypothetical protein